MVGHIGVDSICDFVAIGLFCGAVLTVVVSCFVVLWVFFFFSLLWIGGGGGCGCG